jgi:hypothetical protein
MNRFAFATLFLAIALPATALAQGSGTIAPPVIINNPNPEPPFLVTRSVKGKLAEIRGDLHLIIVKDKNGKRLQFKLDEKTKFRADKKTEYAGKKDLGLGDFELGQPVKVTYIASNNIATELRLLRVRR